MLAIEYEAVLVDDGSGVEETVVNLTNHSYVLSISLFLLYQDAVGGCERRRRNAGRRRQQR